MVRKDAGWARRSVGVAPSSNFYDNAVFRPQCSALPPLRLTRGYCYVSAPNLMPPEEIVIGRHLDPDFGVLELNERSRCPRGCAERSITHRLGRCADVSFVW